MTTDPEWLRVRDDQIASYESGNQFHLSLRWRPAHRLVKQFCTFYNVAIIRDQSDHESSVWLDLYHEHFNVMLYTKDHILLRRYSDHHDKIAETLCRVREIQELLLIPIMVRL